MELHALALPLAYLGAFLGVAMVLPQLTRTIRHPDLEGVSPASWALTSLACLAWLIYGLRADVLPQVPGNVLRRFDAERQNSLAWLRSLQNQNWDRAHQHPQFGPIPAGDLLNAWAAHDMLHIRQITKRLFELNVQEAKPYENRYAGNWAET